MVNFFTEQQENYRKSILADLGNQGLQDKIQPQKYSPTSEVSNMSDIHHNRQQANANNIDPNAATQGHALAVIYDKMDQRLTKFENKYFSYWDKHLKKTTDLLERMRVGLNSRLESLYKEVAKLNDNFAKVYKEQLAFMDQEARGVGNRARMAAMISETVEKSIVGAQKMFMDPKSLENVNYQIMSYMKKIAPSISSMFGFEIQQTKRAMKPAYLTLEGSKVIEKLPTYFKNLSSDIVSTIKAEFKRFSDSGTGFQDALLEIEMSSNLHLQNISKLTDETLALSKQYLIDYRETSNHMRQLGDGNLELLKDGFNRMRDAFAGINVPRLSLNNRNNGLVNQQNYNAFEYNSKRSRAELNKNNKNKSGVSKSWREQLQEEKREREATQKYRTEMKEMVRGIEEETGSLKSVLSSTLVYMLGKKGFFLTAMKSVMLFMTTKAMLPMLFNFFKSSVAMLTPVVGPLLSPVTSLVSKIWTPISNSVTSFMQDKMPRTLEVLTSLKEGVVKFVDKYIMDENRLDNWKTMLKDVITSSLWFTLKKIVYPIGITVWGMYTLWKKTLPTLFGKVTMNDTRANLTSEALTKGSSKGTRFGNIAERQRAYKDAKSRSETAARERFRFTRGGIHTFQEEEREKISKSFKDPGTDRKLATYQTEVAGFIARIGGASASNPQQLENIKNIIARRVAASNTMKSLRGDASPKEYRKALKSVLLNLEGPILNELYPSGSVIDKKRAAKFTQITGFESRVNWRAAEIQRMRQQAEVRGEIHAGMSGPEIERKMKGIRRAVDHSDEKRRLYKFADIAGAMDTSEFQRDDRGMRDARLGRTRGVLRNIGRNIGGRALQGVGGLTTRIGLATGFDQMALMGDRLSGHGAGMLNVGAKSGIFGKIFGGIGKVAGGIGKMLPMVGPLLLGGAMVKKLWSGVAGFLNKDVKELFKSGDIGEIKTEFAGAIKGFMGSMVLKVQEFFSNLSSNWPQIKASIVGIVSGITSVFGSIWDWLTTGGGWKVILTGLRDAVVEVAKMIGEAIWNLGKSILGSVLGWLGFGGDKNKDPSGKSGMNELLEEGKKHRAKEEAKAKAEEQKNETQLNILENMKSVNESIAQTMGSIFGYFKDGKFQEHMNKAMQTAGQAIGTLMKGISSVISGFVNKSGEFMSAMGSGMGHFVKGMFGDTAGSFLDKAIALSEKKGYTGAANLFKSAKRSLADMMGATAGVNSNAADTQLNAALRQKEAAEKFGDAVDKATGARGGRDPESGTGSGGSTSEEKVIVGHNPRTGEPIYAKPPSQSPPKKSSPSGSFLGFSTKDLPGGATPKSGGGSSSATSQALDASTSPPAVVVDTGSGEELPGSSMGGNAGYTTTGKYNFVDDVSKIVNSGIVTSGFYRSPDFRNGEIHGGWDLRLAPGEPVYSGGFGEVVTSTQNSKGFGGAVCVRDKTTNLYTWYGHIKPNVPEGTVVRPGDRIGTGADPSIWGLSYPPHLHIDFRPGNVYDKHKRIAPKGNIFTKWKGVSGAYLEQGGDDQIRSTARRAPSRRTPSTKPLIPNRNSFKRHAKSYATPSTSHSNIAPKLSSLINSDANHFASQIDAYTIAHSISNGGDTSNGNIFVIQSSPTVANNNTSTTIASGGGNENRGRRRGGMLEYNSLC